MADDMRKLLDYIVTQFVVRDEQRAIELDAPPSDNGSNLEDDKREAARRELERADDLAESFARGIALAYRRASLCGAFLSLDDRKPDEERMAEALIRFLVSYDLASSHTEETTEHHYIYQISVYWDRLTEVAKSAGVDLARAMAKYSPA